MPRSDTWQLCIRFLNLSSLDQTERSTQKRLADIIEQISYNPRALQYFLDEATAMLYNTKTHETDTILSSLGAAVEKAYGRWEKAITIELEKDDTSMQNNELFRSFLALLFIYPTHFGATVFSSAEEIGICVSPKRIQDMTEQILEQHNVGALRARSLTGDKLLLLKPSGFIARYLFGHRRVSRAAAQNVGLVRHWISQSRRERIGGAGHLFERVIAAGKLSGGP